MGKAQTDPEAQRRVIQGEAQIVLISPENMLLNASYRNMLLSEKYKQRIIALVVDEAHCVKTWLVTILSEFIITNTICNRGDEFRQTFALIGNLRSLMPQETHVMALTATATKSTFEVVSERLGLINPVVTAASCNRPNIKFIVQPKQQLEDFSTELARNIEIKKLEYPKTIVFCRNYGDCTSLYYTIMEKLGRNATNPPGNRYSSLVEYRYITMYTSAATVEMKEKVMSLFSGESSMRLIIATTAFSMGVDCPDVRQIIHWGASCSLEQYAQEIGRAGRDSQASKAILIKTKYSRFTEASMRNYVENTETCRRAELYKSFIMYEHDSSVDHNECCDICASNIN